MALVVKDRVQEVTTTSGTGTLTLSGAVPGYQTFSSSIGNGNTTFYTIYDNTAQDWEVGIGTVGAGTLARTTVLSNSLGTTAKISFAGNSSFVFCTYPAEQSVNLDASNNVSPLGTIASGTWNGSTIGVAYGGTGVTASSGANSVMLRDSNQNVAVNRLNQSNTNTSAAGGTTALTTASSYIHTLSGTGNQTYTMPDATTLSTGVAFLFNNMATGTLTLQDYATGSIGTIPSGGAGAVFLTVNATVGGTWDLHAYLPEGVTFGTNAFNLGTSVISGGTWQGGTIGTAYGGTGLTTFSAANYALYSTSASALVAGTLPVAAGGTAATTFTANGVIYGNGTSALGVTAAGTTGQVLLANTSGAPTWGSVPSTGAVTSFQTSLNGLTPSTATTGAVTLAGTLGATSGGTGLSAYTTGDIIYSSATNTLARLADVATGNALISGGVGVAPSWGKIGLTTHVSGTLPVANGGTGDTTYTNGQLLIGNTTGNTLTKATLTGTTSQVDVTNGAGSITLSLPATINVNTSGSAATLTTARAIYGNNFNGSAALTQVIASTYGGTGNGFTKFSGPTTSEKTFTLPDATATILTTNAAVTATQGGTGLTSYTTGDIIYASATNTLARLADVATGNALISGGVGVAPSWGKIGLTTHITGTLAVGNGGTGATTLTGILKGNGTSAFTAATAGTDYGAPATAATWSAPQRGTVTTDNDLSFDMSVTNNFKCTPTALGTLTFTNITSGQSGFVLLVNTGGYAISAAATTEVSAGTLTTISTAGTYLLSYFSDGTNVYVTNSGALA